MSFLSKIDRDLEGAPEEVLTSILFIIAGIAIALAIWGKPSYKAIAAAWFVAP